MNIASIIGSGINGNCLQIESYSMRSLWIASIIGSGINGNTIQELCYVIEADHSGSLLLLEVELMETSTQETWCSYQPSLSLLLLEVELMETHLMPLSAVLHYLNRFYYWKWN